MRRYKSRWGANIKPRFPYAVRDIFQGWRDNRVMSEMLALKCPKCGKVFFIARWECQKELVCPWRCGVVAEYVWQKGELLSELLEAIIDSDPPPEQSLEHNE